MHQQVSLFPALGLCITHSWIFYCFQLILSRVLIWKFTYKIRKQKAGIFSLTKQIVLESCWRWIEISHSHSLPRGCLCGYQSHDPLVALHSPRPWTFLLSGSLDPEAPSWIHGWQPQATGVPEGPTSCILCQQPEQLLNPSQALPTKTAARGRKREMCVWCPKLEFKITFSFGSVAPGTFPRTLCVRASWPPFPFCEHTSLFQPRQPCSHCSLCWELPAIYLLSHHSDIIQMSLPQSAFYHMMTLALTFFIALFTVWITSFICLFIFMFCVPHCCLSPQRNISLLRVQTLFLFVHNCQPSLRAMQ